MTTNLSLFAQRLRDARMALGQSQADMAAATGVTREQWGRYERGISVPGGDVLVRLAAMGADAHFLLMGEGTAITGMAPDEQRLLALYRLADAAVRKAVIGALAAGEPPAVAPAAAPPPAPTRIRKGSMDVVIHGEVGQQFHGNHPGATFHVDMGRDKTKK